MSNGVDRLPRWLIYVGAGAACAAIGLYLWMAHRQHLASIVFYGLALACPLMHVFGHGRHGAHADDGRRHTTHGSERP